MDAHIEYETGDELKRIRYSYLLHVLDFVCQERETVFRNDMKVLQEKNKDKVTVKNVFDIASKGQQDEELSSQGSDIDVSDDLQSEEDQQDGLKVQQNDMISTVMPPSSDSLKDQGFTRPKVLILCPFKQMAADIVEMIVFMLNGGKWQGVSRRKKFKQDFRDPEDGFNDNFKIGMALKYSSKTQQAQLKLYEPFYESDIIVASPLAIRFLTGQESDETAQKQNKIDCDFLSSIEFLVFDKAEAFVFQNPEHLEELMKVINKTPKKMSGLNDITRMKDIYTHQSPKLPKFLR